MTTEKYIPELMSKIKEKIKIKDLPESIKNNFTSNYNGIIFEGLKETISYNYPLDYPFNILKFNPIKNTIIIEYQHVIPKKMQISEIDYKTLLDLSRKLEGFEERENLSEILKLLQQEGFDAKIPLLSDDSMFIKFEFNKDEFTVKLNIIAKFYNSSNWIPNAGE